MLESDKEAALSQLDIVKSQLADSEAIAQKVHEEKCEENKKLTDQIFQLEEVVEQLTVEKTSLDKELMETKEKLEKEHELLLKNDHDETLNSLETRLLEAEERHQGSSANNFLQVYFGCHIFITYSKMRNIRSLQM